MKTFPLFPIVALAFALLVSPVCAADPQPAAMSPEIQALIAQLMEVAAAAQADTPTLVPTPAASAPAPAPKSAAPAASNLQTGGLTTGGLRSSSLTASASLSGRGTVGGAARLNDDDWRQLFSRQMARLIAR